MLIEFNVENFRSFRDHTTLSMVSAKSFKEHADSHLIGAKRNLTLLKSAIIYGNNASGKSNLFEAMGFMKQTVLNSFRDTLIDQPESQFVLQQFALNTESAKEASYFELSFIQKDIKYRYGFEIDHQQIVSEWLFHTSSKEVYLFKRDLQKIEVNRSAFKEGLGKEGDVRENVLFLSLLATLGKEISSDIVTWFKKFNIIHGIHDRRHNRYTMEKLKSDSDFLSWVMLFIKYLEIANLSITEEEVIEDDFEFLSTKQKQEEVINLRTSIQNMQTKQGKGVQLLSAHRIYDENSVLVDTSLFNFDSHESEGTKRLLYLLGPWYDALQNGKVLLIDELDIQFHSHLTLRLVEFFHKFNKNNAQLVSAVHDISLLNKDVYRRDQIWFVEKDQFGASKLYALAEFKTDKVRNKSAFDKNYLEGKYGAIPYFDLDDKLNELLYGKKGAAK